MIYETLVLGSVTLIAPVFGKFASMSCAEKPCELVVSSREVIHEGDRKWKLSTCWELQSS